MFADKRLGWKLAGALALLAALCMFGGWRGRSVNPPMWRCIARPDVWDGAAVRFGGRVEEVMPGAFACRMDLAHVLVTGGESVREGDEVEVAGVFRKEGLLVEVRRMRTIPEHAGNRGLLNLISLVVLLFVLGNFIRHFAFRPQALHAEGSD